MVFLKAIKLHSFYFPLHFPNENINFGSLQYVGEKYKLKDIFDQNLTEIYKGSKSGHLREISKKSGYSLEEMIFFDNEWGNCQTVAKIGVTVVYTPKGVTRHLFQEALDQFPAPGHIIGKRKS